MSSFEHTKNSGYIQFKSLLERAVTFNHLIFYNGKLVNHYAIASHGFKLSKTRDGHQQAKCSSCSLGFRLDDLQETERIQIKQNLSQALINHEEQCKFNFPQKKSMKVIVMNIQNLGQHGVALFSEILQQNNKHLQIISQISSLKQLKQSFFNTKASKLIKQFTCNNAKFESNVLVSLLGWKIVNQKEFACQYCGAHETNNLKFSPSQNHKSWCGIASQKYWQTILYKLVASKLQLRQGEFLKTEGQIKTKQLKLQLQKFTQAPIQSLKNFKLKIKNIKSDLKYLQEEQQDNQYCDVQDKLSTLSDFADGLQNFLKTSVKKIKLQ